MKRHPISQLDQSGAVDGDAILWDDAAGLWVPGAAGAPDLSPYATLASPTFTGDPKAPTPAPGDNDTSIATTAFVAAVLASYATLASPTFTGDPKAPTPALGDSDTSIATTAFVAAAVAAGVAAAPALLIPPLKSGTYYSNPFASGSSTTAITGGALELHPFPVPFACTLDRIGAECTVSNAAGRLRLGIYRSDANGNPSTLLLDAGQVTSVGTGTREINIAQAMTPGQYWLACLGDVAGGTWRTWGATPVAAVLGFSGIVAGSAYTRLGATGVATGVLPTPAPATPPIASATGGFRIFARAQ